MRPMGNQIEVAHRAAIECTPVSEHDTTSAAWTNNAWLMCAARNGWKKYQGWAC